MRRDDKETPTGTMKERLKRLPHRLRIVHLRALIGWQFPGSPRRRELVALLRDEMAAQAGTKGGLA
jgi:hypothetical protein